MRMFWALLVFAQVLVFIDSCVGQVDGDWGPWHPWSSCSVSCGAEGFSVRLRSCDNPAPSDGGLNCLGKDLQVRICNEVCGPVDGGWGTWHPWSTCSVFCGDGFHVRLRSCDSPTPQLGGKPCVGSEVNTRACNGSCGATWSDWTSWADCSVSCENGTTSRNRSCDYPPGQDATTAFCDGDTSEIAPCDTNVSCPVDGGWSPWIPWAPCDVTCGTGNHYRLRQCRSPPPQYGGQMCQGDEIETKPCQNISARCPVDGDWSSWGDWGECSSSCDEGLMTRYRQCVNPEPQAGGRDCVGVGQETANCTGNGDPANCTVPVDGGWANWGQWGECSSSCDEGLMTRYRQCVNPEPQAGGRDCVGIGQEIANCTGNNDSANCTVPVDGGWANWGQWGECSSSCDEGLMTRYRQCVNPEPQAGGRDCVGIGQETANCTGNNDSANCTVPVDGGWANWGQWGECSSSCDEGLMTRLRQCVNPEPQAGGRDCVGIGQETANCTGNNDSANCTVPVNGGWANWGQWGECSSSCDEGLMTRYRQCVNPEPQAGGRDCVGIGQETANCTGINDSANCTVPIDGDWSNWEQWSECSSTCDDGLMTRHRQCVNPEPQAGGRDCVGVGQETANCTGNGSLINCTAPIDGDWSTWGEWGKCSSSCDEGLMTRYRQCINPEPQAGGRDCVGVGQETANCTGNGDPANCTVPVDGDWSSWGEWSECSSSCDEGLMTRYRQCINPEPQAVGRDCVGVSQETANCTGNGDPANCTVPIDGEWSSWGQWGECSSTCDEGLMTRYRQCNNPEPQASGRNCVGIDQETTNCTGNNNTENCTTTADGTWGSWGEFSPCSVTCGQGMTERVRMCENMSGHNITVTCIGKDKDIKLCTAHAVCPVDGDWSLWLSWSPCSVTCGDGDQSRSRKCNQPSPQHGGQTCVGDSIETKSCSNTCTDPTAVV